MSHNCSNVVPLRRTLPEPFAAKWREAERCIAAKDFGTALTIFEGLAAEGYAEAYAEIGNILEIRASRDTNVDLDVARSWYMRAIEEIGDPHAYIGLARLALNGYQEAGSTDDAIEYLNIAARANKPVALIILGTLYHAGKIVSRDTSKAADFYTKAMATGYILPMLYLSKIELERGNIFKFLRLRLAALRQACRIVLTDRHDPRLWNVR